MGPFQVGFASPLARDAPSVAQDVHGTVHRYLQTLFYALRSLKKLFHGEMEDFEQLVAPTAAVWLLMG